MNGEKICMSRLSPEDISRMNLELVPGTTDQYRKKKKQPAQIKKDAVKKKKEENNIEYAPIGTTICISWSKDHVSLNEWYSSKHWSNRNKVRNKWHEKFQKAIPLGTKKFNKYQIALEYNSRLDPCNTITMVKLCEDALQELNIIEKDTKEYCRGVYLIPNISMKKNHYRIFIKAVK